MLWHNEHAHVQTIDTLPEVLDCCATIATPLMVGDGVEEFATALLSNVCMQQGPG